MEHYSRCASNILKKGISIFEQQAMERKREGKQVRCTLLRSELLPSGVGSHGCMVRSFAIEDDSHMAHHKIRESEPSDYFNLKLSLVDVNTHLEVASVLIDVILNCCPASHSSLLSQKIFQQLYREAQNATEVLITPSQLSPIITSSRCLPHYCLLALSKQRIVVGLNSTMALIAELQLSPQLSEQKTSTYSNMEVVLKLLLCEAIISISTSDSSVCKILPSWFESFNLVTQLQTVIRVCERFSNFMSIAPAKLSTNLNFAKSCSRFSLAAALRKFVVSHEFCGMKIDLMVCRSSLQSIHGHISNGRLDFNYINPYFEVTSTVSIFNRLRLLGSQSVVR